MSNLSKKTDFSNTLDELQDKMNANKEKVDSIVKPKESNQISKSDKRINLPDKNNSNKSKEKTTIQTSIFSNPPAKETRSKKLNYLTTPSLAKEFKAKCKERKMSENEAINQLMQFFINN